MPSKSPPGRRRLIPFKPHSAGPARPGRRFCLDAWKNYVTRPIIMNPERDLNMEDLQRLVERFAKAGWLAGEQVVMPDKYRLNYSDLGRARLLAIADQIKPFAPKLFDFVQVDSGPASFVPIMSAIAATGAELQPPPLSSGELDCLFGLVVLEEKKRWRLGRSDYGPGGCSP